MGDDEGFVAMSTTAMAILSRFDIVSGRDYQNAKCMHGDPDETPTFSVDIPRLSRSYLNAEAGIEHGEMCFTKYGRDSLANVQADLE